MRTADTRAALDDCPARHVPQAPAGARRLEWMAVYGTLRVYAHTCDRHGRVSYEFGLLGGGYVIRRTDRSRPHTPVIRQTPTVRRTLALQWWDALLRGHAV
jgi:hypothetical protein